MFIIIIALGLLAVLMVAFAFLPSESKKQTSSRNKQDKQNDIKPQIDMQALKIKDLELQINSLKEELEKSKSELQKAQNELNDARTRESELKIQIEKLKEWDVREQAEVEKDKKEVASIKEQLLLKQQEMEKDFAQNVNLNKELREKTERLSILEKEKQEMSNRIGELESQVDTLKKELEEKTATLAEIKLKEQDSEWVSKQQFLELKKKLKIKELEIRKLQERLNETPQVKALINIPEEEMGLEIQSTVQPQTQTENSEQ
ncbi:MAG: hypothetical protein NC908_05605, partial [Candidatus Omnitrophica bacterium]|nr:hypothetical protein [Candidatus Omnitrophota bacterium]